MFKYFIEGGPLFMGMLSIVLLVIIVIAVYAVISNDGHKPELYARRLASIRSLGLFAFVLGMLGQFIGLFSAFDTISAGMEISPAIMAQGVKVSMVTSIYGMVILLVAYLLWFVLSALGSKS